MYITICEIDHQSKFNAWNRTLKDSALGQPWGMGWGRKWEAGSGWGTRVHPWLIHVNVWQKPPQYCREISLQLKLKKKKGQGIQPQKGSFKKITRCLTGLINQTIATPPSFPCPLAISAGIRQGLSQTNLWVWLLSNGLNPSAIHRRLTRFWGKLFCQKPTDLN